MERRPSDWLKWVKMHVDVVNVIDLLSIVDAVILKSDKTIVDKVFSERNITN